MRVRDVPPDAVETRSVTARSPIAKPESVDRALFATRLEELRRLLLASLPAGGRAWERADVVQDVLLALWRRPTQLAPKSAVELARYARVAMARASRDECRSELRCDRRESKWALEQPPDAPAAEELLLRRDDIEFCRRLMRALPQALLDALVAHEIELLTTAEAAALLGVSETSIKSRLRRARKMLKRLYVRAHLFSASPPALKRSKHGNAK